MLNNSQQHAYKLLLKFLESDEQVFSILGKAGSGKSFLIDYIRNNVSNIFVTATTNEAAKVINGITIHKYAGFRVRSYQETDGQHHPDDIILIDEASMLKICILKHLVAKGNKIILVGDPRQLVVGLTVAIDSYPSYELTQNMRAKSEKLSHLVDCLTEAVELDTAINMVDHIGDHLEFINDHDEFKRIATRVDNINSQTLAYTNKVVDSYIEHCDTGLTVHKSQGKSYDEVYFDVRDLIDAYTKRRNKYNNPLDKQTYLRLLLVGISRAMYKVYLFVGEKRNWQDY